MIDKFNKDLLSVVKGSLFQWDLASDAGIDLLTISENATFLVDTGKQQHIVRIYRPNYHTNSEILSELLWLQAIEHSGIVSVPHLFTSRSGKLFIESGLLRLACFSFMEGHEPCPDNELVRWFKVLGTISAKLHRQSKEWQKPQGFTRKHWTYETMIGKNAYWGHWQKVEGLSSTDLEILELCDKTLKSVTSKFPTDNAHYGLIHGDLRLANLLLDGESLGAIDFDDCGFSWFGLDLANSLSFIEDNPLIADFIEAWFQGYSAVMPVPEVMREMVPHLIMMRRMQLTAWLESHNTTPTAKALRKHYPKGTVKLACRYLKKFTPHFARSKQHP